MGATASASHHLLENRRSKWLIASSLRYPQELLSSRLQVALDAHAVVVTDLGRIIDQDTLVRILDQFHLISRAEPETTLEAILTFLKQDDATTATVHHHDLDPSATYVRYDALVAFLAPRQIRGEAGRKSLIQPVKDHRIFPKLKPTLAQVGVGLGCSNPQEPPEEEASRLDSTGFEQHPPSSFWLAAKRGDLELLRHMVEQHEIEYDAKDSFDNTAVYYASLCGHAPVVQYLLEKYTSSHKGRMDPDEALRCITNALTQDIRWILQGKDTTPSQEAAEWNSHREEEEEEEEDFVGAWFYN